MWSDTLIGTIEVKPLLLEGQSTVILDTDILENKKPTGGKVSVQMRMQYPIVNRQYDIKYEKILTIQKHYSLMDMLQNQQPEIEPVKPKENPKKNYSSCKTEIKTNKI